MCAKSAKDLEGGGGGKHRRSAVINLAEEEGQPCQVTMSLTGHRGSGIVKKGTPKDAHGGAEFIVKVQPVLAAFVAGARPYCTADI